MNLQIFMFVCAFATAVQAYKVLVLVPINGKSHWNYMQVFVKEFLNRGHEVTAITSITLGGKKHNNYTEILIDPPFDMQSLMKQEDIFNKASDSPIRTAAIFPVFAKISANHSLSDKKVRQFIHSKDLHFDLIINEEVYHDAYLMFGRKFNAPVVGICPYGIPNMFDHEMGLLTPISHVSHTMLTYTDDMDFAQRWFNAFVCLYDWILFRFVHAPAQNGIIKEHFGHMGQLPTVDELRKNVSIVFVNAHRSITHPRPTMPGLIFIGGAHIKPPKPLPNDLQTFLDQSEHGVIYFSLGTVVNTSKMPKEKLNIFLNVFRRLKQRVIWKFEDESIPNLPENVLIRKWLPQPDILAHPNVVLFITHGGMFSNFEANKYGIPLLVIPFVGDQYRNALRIQSAGYGKFMDFKDITLDALHGVLSELLTDKKYLNRAKEIAAVFGDNIVDPMAEFIYWCEYVIKFRGAKHLKSAAIDMPLFTYLLLDVILVNLLIASVAVFSVYYLIKRLLLLCKKKNEKSTKKQQ